MEQIRILNFLLVWIVLILTSTPSLDAEGEKRHSIIIDNYAGFGIALDRRNGLLYTSSPKDQKVTAHRIELQGQHQPQIVLGEKKGFDFTGGFDRPHGLWLDPENNLFVADTRASVVFKVITYPTTLAHSKEVFAGSLHNPGYRGDGKSPSAARFRTPIGGWANSLGTHYIIDSHDCTVRSISRNETTKGFVVNLIFGQHRRCGKAEGLLHYPYSIAGDHDGNIFIAEYFSHRIIEVSFVHGFKLETHIIGGVQGKPGFTPDGHYPIGEGILTTKPTGLAYSNRTLFYAESEEGKSNRIRALIFGADGLQLITVLETDSSIHFQAKHLQFLNQTGLIVDAANSRVIQLVNCFSK